MSKRPGGELATRPLHFMWLCDCSGSMSIDGKMEALNRAIADTLPEMRRVADENPYAQVMMRCVKFSHGAEWHIPLATPLEEFQWHELVADPLDKPSVDVVFLIDTSGSMAGEIDGVKRSCASFADLIEREGANVRLGLVGFDIGGHRGSRDKSYVVHNLSRYTIGVWPLTTPSNFKRDVSALSLSLFGGGGCYLANRDTVDIFPHVVELFNSSGSAARVLVIISDEIGGAEGVADIVSQLKKANITTHVMGVPGSSGAHQSIAHATGGKFWDITRGKYDFDGLFVGEVATTVAKESVKRLTSGALSAGTDIGAALQLVAQELKIPPMTDRALPPVLVLISDGKPTDDFESGLTSLLEQPWGKKAVRIAIAIGSDAEMAPLQAFIGNRELQPLRANNPASLVRYIRWASTAVLKSASSPAIRPPSGLGGPVTSAPIPMAAQMPPPLPAHDEDVW
jgi:uncharacterized protein YegL